MNVTEKKFKTDFIKECNKNKSGWMKLVPSFLKGKGCKAAADKAWKNFQKNGPAKGKSILDRFKEEDKINWKW